MTKPNTTPHEHAEQDCYSFFVPIEPRGKPRHRSARAGGFMRSYPDAKGVRWESDFAALVSQHLPTGKLWTRETPISLSIDAFFDRPVAMQKQYKDGTWKFPGMPAHVHKPDADNVAKIVMDALTPWLWDDCQIAGLHVVKLYREPTGKDFTAMPGIYIRIERMVEE